MADRDRAPVVVVAGVALPADELAAVLDRYALGRVLKDQRKPAGEPAFRSGPWFEAVRRLRDPSVHLSESAQIGADFLPAGRLVSCTEYAAMVGAAPGTVRRWATAGQLPGAARSAGTWLIPADTPPPRDRRRRTTRGRGRAA